MKTPYIPISCDFHSILEDAATRKLKVLLKLKVKKSILIQKVMIIDIYTKNKEEFLVTSSDDTYRLDQIISLNDYLLSDFSCSV